MSFHFLPLSVSIRALRCLAPLAAAAVLLSGCATTVAPREALAPGSPVLSADFRQAMGSVIAPAFVPGNSIRVLSNGNQIFPAMLAAIRAAKKTIDFETYVYEKGEVPEAFVQALVQRARAGVRVNCILDAVGAKKSKSYHRRLTEAGVRIEPFHPVSPLAPHRYDYRTHRKILVVDGKIGFIGGVGIADQWGGDARSPEEWRDLHFRLDGPAVAQLQGAFAANWFYTSNEILRGPDYFPALSAAGPVSARVFVSTPRQTFSAVEVSYEMAIAGAHDTVRIESPYFIPTGPLLDALTGAARRGVQVQVIMPGEHIDQKAVRRASRKLWPRLMAAGVELYEFQPTMIHTKLLIVDGHFVSIGSANFDPRSLRINDEANLNALDSAFAARMTDVFRKDQLRTKRLQPGDAMPGPFGFLQTPVESQL